MLFRIEFRTKMSEIAFVYLPPSGARGLERLIWLKYYDLVKRQIKFTFGLNAADSNALNLKKLQIKVVSN